MLRTLQVCKSEPLDFAPHDNIGEGKNGPKIELTVKQERGSALKIIYGHIQSSIGVLAGHGRTVLPFSLEI